jgi:hypothetical protein
VRYAAQNGLFAGMSATTFGPEANMTRGMLVTVLHRLEGKPRMEGEIPFTDAGRNNYYGNAVAWAYQNGIVAGYGDGRFGSDDSITREQLAAILYRYAGFKGRSVAASGDLSAFTDIAAGYGSNAVKWAVGSGLIGSTTAGAATLEPKGAATRAQVAAILMRYAENIIK